MYEEQPKGIIIILIIGMTIGFLMGSLYKERKMKELVDYCAIHERSNIQNCVEGATEREPEDDSPY